MRSTFNFLRNEYVQALFVFLFVFAIYENAIWHDYVQDDEAVITKNRYTKKGVDGVVDIVVHDAFYGYLQEDAESNIEGGRYRPLSLVTFALEYEYFGLNPMVSHSVNVLLYAFTGIVLLLLTRAMFSETYQKPFSDWMPFFTTILFMMHPIHTEVVANIKGRDELLCWFFFLLAMYVAYKVLHKDFWMHFLSWPLIAVFYFCSLLAKETAITFLLVVPLVLHFFGKIRKRDFLWTMVPFLSVTILYAFMLNSAIHVPETASGISEVLTNPFAHASVLEKYSTIVYIMGKYILLLIFPHPLSHDYSFNQIPLLVWYDWRVLLSAAVFLACAGYALTHFGKRQLLSFCFLFFVATILLASNLFISAGVPMAERFLYIPSFGFCVALVFLLQRLYMWIRKGLHQRRTTASYINWAIMLTLLVTFSIKTILRNADWENNRTLLEADIEATPNNAKLHNDLGYELFKAYLADNKQTALADRAIKHYEMAVKIHPYYATAWYHLGNVVAEYKKDNAAAIKHYRKATTIYPKFGLVYQKAALIALESKDYRAAQWAAAGWVKSESKNSKAFLALAQAYENLGVQDSCFAAYAASSQFDPRNPEPYTKLGMLSATIFKDFNMATAYLESALRCQPDYMAAKLELGKVYVQESERYFKMNKKDSAAFFMQKANLLASQ
ncbi:MAG: DUF1736 domain-containing protein [Cytophagales bacterium]|nr:MAG: DUF1736 domain-containing protein [Cytophagales bacterium]